MVRRLALLAVLALTACSAQPDTTPAPTPSATPTVVPLTATQATKAALQAADLPKGWEGAVAVDPTPTPGLRGQYDPPECLVFRHPTDLLGTPATAVRAHYFLRPELPTVDEFVWSWPTQLGTVMPDLVGQLPRCRQYSMIDTYKQAYHWTAKQLPVPGVRDCLVLRYDATPSDEDDVPFADYMAYVVRGSAVVNLEAGGDGITDATFTQLVIKAVARLDAVVG
ncbi:MAG TPA: hypothetical protein VFH76_24340 [Kribbella sp.]|nr:hypothetical protein [Kribbella sp.]